MVPYIVRFFFAKSKGNDQTLLYQCELYLPMDWIYCGDKAISSTSSGSSNAKWGAQNLNWIL